MAATNGANGRANGRSANSARYMTIYVRLRTIKGERNRRCEGRWQLLWSRARPGRRTRNWRKGYKDIGLELEEKTIKFEAKENQKVKLVEYFGWLIYDRLLRVGATSTNYMHPSCFHHKGTTSHFYDASYSDSATWLCTSLWPPLRPWQWLRLWLCQPRLHDALIAPIAIHSLTHTIKSIKWGFLLPTSKTTNDQYNYILAVIMWSTARWKQLNCYESYLPLLWIS